MDKLRAIEYFNRAVSTASFAGAARSLEVSTPAVTQLVATLERSLGVTLFHRSPRGLTLTAAGERYYEVSRKLTAELRDVEQRMGPRGAKPCGTLTVGMRHAVGQNCIMPRIGRFLERFPDIDVVVKSVECVGVMRLADLTISRHLSAGLLVPVLTDWEVLEAPLIFAAYPRVQRSSKLVRVFIDFLVEVFAELESERGPASAGAVPRVSKPEWFGRTHGRHSIYASRGKGKNGFRASQPG